MRVYDAEKRDWVLPECPECAKAAPFRNGQRVRLTNYPDREFTVKDNVAVLTLNGHAGIQFASSKILCLRRCSLVVVEK